MGHITESLVGFIESAPEYQLKQHVTEIILSGFTDTIGVMIAGADEPVTTLLCKQFSLQGGTPESRILLGTERCLAMDAGLINTAAAHALDFDDYAFSNHVSALLVPAILAEAEVTKSNGKQMLAAYAAGYECWGAVMRREPNNFYTKGWHPTAIFGAIGVVAACAVLHRADTNTIRNALGLTAAYGGGVMANFGTMAKPIQGGKAVSAGITAMRMALAGIDAGPDALDGKKGYLAACSPKGNVDLETRLSLGAPWYLDEQGLNIKQYPTVGASQRNIDAALQLKHDLQPDLTRIKKVHAHLSEKHAALMEFHQPQNALEAKFSMQFAIAAALHAGRVSLHELSDEYVQRNDVQHLMQQIELCLGPDDDPVFPEGAAEDWIEIEMDDGSTQISKKVQRARGHGLNPMSKQQLQEKFMACTTTQLDDSDAEILYGKIQQLPDLESVLEIST